VRAVDGLLSPERFLTKICMVSSGSAEEARSETLEMLLERMVVLRVGCCCKVVAVMSRERCSCGCSGGVGVGVSRSEVAAVGRRW